MLRGEEKLLRKHTHRRQMFFRGRKQVRKFFKYRFFVHIIQAFRCQAQEELSVGVKDRIQKMTVVSVETAQWNRDGIANFKETFH